MALIAASKRTEGRNAHLIRHRLHLRLEIDNVGVVEDVARHIAAGEVDELSFMDHTPGQGQYRDLEIWRRSVRSDRELSMEDALEVAKACEESPKITLDALTSLASLAREHGVPVASHDDDTVEKLELMQQLGCTISEFPISLEVAAEARRRGIKAP